MVYIVSHSAFLVDVKRPRPGQTLSYLLCPNVIYYAIVIRNIIVWTSTKFSFCRWRDHLISLDQKQELKSHLLTNLDSNLADLPLLVVELENNVTLTTTKSATVDDVLIHGEFYVNTFLHGLKHDCIHK